MKTVLVVMVKVTVVGVVAKGWKWLWCRWYSVGVVAVVVVEEVVGVLEVEDILMVVMACPVCHQTC